MNQDDWPFRSVYLDPDLDDQLRDQAAALGVGKAELFRQRLKAGMKAARGRPDLLNFAHCASPLVLRTVRMDPKVDHALIVQAFEMRQAKNDLIRVYAKLGLAL